MKLKWAVLWMTKSICFFAMGCWYLIAVHLLIVTKLTIVHAIVIEEFILFPRNLLHCWLLSILPFFFTGKDGWLEASSGSLYCSDALPPASLASIPCLYVLYWIYVERENFQHKKNVESAISYNTFWLELMKDFSEQPDKTCYIVFIIHMLFQKLFSQCSESVIDLLIPIECSPSASVNKIFVGTIIYIHRSLCLPSPYVINCRVPALFIWGLTKMHCSSEIWRRSCRWPNLARSPTIFGEISSQTQYNKNLHHQWGYLRLCEIKLLKLSCNGN